MYRGLFLLILLVVALATAPVLAADDWSQERYDPSNTAGYSGDAGGPWAFDVGVTVDSPVVMSEGTVYFYDDDADLHSFDPEEEQRNWVYEAEGETPMLAPVVHNGTAYVATISHLAAVDSEGDAKWQMDIGLTSAPAIRNGTVYFGDTGSLRAVDATTGEDLWQTDVDGDLYMFTRVLDDIYGISADEGAGERLEQAVAEGIERDYRQDMETPQVPDRIDFGRYIDAEDSGFRVQSFTTEGSERWEFSEGIPILSPAAADDRVFVSSLNYTVYGLDPDTGNVDWESETGDVQNTPPVYSDGTVHVGTRSGDIHGFDADSGEELWKMNTEFGSASRIAIAEDTMYVTSTASRSGVYAYDTTDGELDWSARLDGDVTVEPTAVGSSVLVASGTEIYAVTDGEVSSPRRIIDDVSAAQPVGGDEEVDDTETTDGTDADEDDDTDTDDVDEEDDVFDFEEDGDEVPEPGAGQDAITIILPLLVGLVLVASLAGFYLYRKKRTEN